MAYQFNEGSWANEVAEESTKPQYQQARVEIHDPSLQTRTYDVDTAKWTITGDSKVYPVGDEDGRARLIGVRWGVFSGGESQANATTLTAVRLQIPQHAVGRVKRGMTVKVLSAPNPVLKEYSIKITSDLQGSSDAARTFECAIDMDSKVAP